VQRVCNLRNIVVSYSVVAEEIVAFAHIRGNGKEYERTDKDKGTERIKMAR
jgi:hypothetical protein